MRRWNYDARPVAAFLALLPPPLVASGPDVEIAAQTAGSCTDATVISMEGLRSVAEGTWWRERGALILWGLLCFHLAMALVARSAQTPWSGAVLRCVRSSDLKNSSTSRLPALPRLLAEASGFPPEWLSASDSEGLWNAVLVLAAARHLCASLAARAGVADLDVQAVSTGHVIGKDKSSGGVCLTPIAEVPGLKAGIMAAWEVEQSCIRSRDEAFTVGRLAAAVSVMHPLLSIRLPSTRRPWRFQVLILFIAVFGSLAVAALAFSMFAKSASCGEEHDEGSSWKSVWRDILITLVSPLLAWLPLPFLAPTRCLSGREGPDLLPGVCKIVAGDERKLKAGTCLFAASILVIILFLANVSMINVDRWLFAVVLRLLVFWTVVPVVVAMADLLAMKRVMTQEGRFSGLVQAISHTLSRAEAAPARTAWVDEKLQGSGQRRGSKAAVDGPQAKDAGGKPPCAARKASHLHMPQPVAPETPACEDPPKLFVAVELLEDPNQLSEDFRLFTADLLRSLSPQKRERAPKQPEEVVDIPAVEHQVDAAPAADAPLKASPLRTHQMKPPPPPEMLCGMAPPGEEPPQLFATAELVEDPNQDFRHFTADLICSMLADKKERSLKKSRSPRSHGSPKGDKSPNKIPGTPMDHQVESAPAGLACVEAAPGSPRTAPGEAVGRRRGTAPGCLEQDERHNLDDTKATGSRSPRRLSLPIDARSLPPQRDGLASPSPAAAAIAVRCHSVPAEAEAKSDATGPDAAGRQRPVSTAPRLRLESSPPQDSPLRTPQPANPPSPPEIVCAPVEAVPAADSPSRSSSSPTRSRPPPPPQMLYGMAPPGEDPPQLFVAAGLMEDPDLFGEDFRHFAADLLRSMLADKKERSPKKSRSPGRYRSPRHEKSPKMIQGSPTDHQVEIAPAELPRATRVPESPKPVPGEGVAQPPGTGPTTPTAFPIFSKRTLAQVEQCGLEDNADPARLQPPVASSLAPQRLSLPIDSYAASRKALFEDDACGTDSEVTSSTTAAVPHSMYGEAETMSIATREESIAELAVVCGAQGRRPLSAAEVSRLCSGPSLLRPGSAPVNTRRVACAPSRGSALARHLEGVPPEDLARYFPPSFFDEDDRLP